MAVLGVSFSADCSWRHERVCPIGLYTHCENGGIYTCVDGEDDGDVYQEGFHACGSGKMCLEKGAVECVVSPLRACTRSACSGDTNVVCGATGYVTDEMKCTNGGRICAESSSSAICVLPEPCPVGKVSFCSADSKAVNEGCDKGYGYPTSRKTCTGCGTPICVNGTTSAACAESPGMAYDASRGYICSSDGYLSLNHKTDTGPYYECVQDCTISNQRCISSTGRCGYDISCGANQESKCSPDKKSAYLCNTRGMYVEHITNCSRGTTCAETESSGKIYARCK